MDARVSRFTRGWEVHERVGLPGIRAGQFDGPFGIAVDSRGRSTSSTEENYRVQKFSADGVYISQWGSSGDGRRAVHESARYRVRRRRQRVRHRLSTSGEIQKFTSEGSYSTSGAASGRARDSSPDRKASPSTVIIVYVADTENDRIQAFDLDGNFLLAVGIDRRGDGQFNDRPASRSTQTATSTSADTTTIGSRSSRRMETFSRRGAAWAPTTVSSCSRTASSSMLTGTSTSTIRGTTASRSSRRWSNPRPLPQRMETGASNVSHGYQVLDHPGGGRHPTRPFLPRHARSSVLLVNTACFPRSIVVVTFSLVRRRRSAHAVRVVDDGVATQTTT